MGRPANRDEGAAGGQRAAGGTGWKGKREEEREEEGRAGGSGRGAGQGPPAGAVQRRRLLKARGSAESPSGREGGAAKSERQNPRALTSLIGTERSSAKPGRSAVSWNSLYHPEAREKSSKQSETRQETGTNPGGGEANRLPWGITNIRVSNQRGKVWATEAITEDHCLSINKGVRPQAQQPLSL